MANMSLVQAENFAMVCCGLDGGIEAALDCVGLLVVLRRPHGNCSSRGYAA